MVYASAKLGRQPPYNAIFCIDLPPQGFRQQATLSLAASVGAVASLELHDGSYAVVVGTSNGKVSAYTLEREGRLYSCLDLCCSDCHPAVASADFSLMQTLDPKSKIPMDMALAFLPGSKSRPWSMRRPEFDLHPSTAVILAIGGTDSKIHLFTRSQGGQVLSLDSLFSDSS